MCPAQVRNMDKIADAGSIGCGQIFAKDFEGGRSAQDCLQRQGDQVRFRIMTLADLTTSVSARGIEISKAHMAKPVRVSG